MLSWPHKPESVASLNNIISTDSGNAVAKQRLADIPSRQLFPDILAALRLVSRGPACPDRSIGVSVHPDSCG